MIKYFTAALTGAILLSATSAGAVTMTQNRVVSGDGETTATINDFTKYSGTGTLNSVQLDWNVNVTGEIGSMGPVYDCAFNGDCEPGTFTLTLEGFGDLATAFDTATQASGIDNSTDAGQTGSINMTITGLFSYGTLANFVGAGLVAGSVDITGFYLGFPDFLDSSIRTGNVSLTYDITQAPTTTPVPEPGTMAMFGLGLAGLGFIRRRKVA